MTSIQPDTKLIGTGSYGCIFKPSFTSKRSRNSSTNNKTKKKTAKISKLLIKSKDKELKQLKRLHEINSNSKYHPEFNPEEDIIETNETEEIIKELKEKHGLTQEQCKLISDTNFGDKYIINMEFAGNDIDKYLKSTGILNQEQTNRFLSDYINIIDALILFRDNKLIHMDIKTLNVIYNPELPEHRLRLIDFGLMIDLNEMNKDNYKTILEANKYLYIYDYSYVYSPEILLLITDIYNMLYDYVEPLIKAENIIASNSNGNTDNSNNERKQELINTLSNYIIRKSKLSETKLGVKLIANIDVYIKMFETNIRKYKYTRDGFQYSLSKKILRITDTYSLINVISQIYEKLTDIDNQIADKIISLMPPYNGIKQSTIFSLPSLEKIKELFQAIIKNY